MNIDNSLNEELFNNLSAAATNPSAEGKASGVAFEEEITKIFRYMGFEAKRIGGSGNTDVVVKWKMMMGKLSQVLLMQNPNQTAKFHTEM